MINSENSDQRLKFLHVEKDILSYDICRTIRWYVALNCDDQMDILVNDPDPFIRETVAKYGSDQHRDMLITDSHAQVRFAAIRFSEM